MRCIVAVAHFSDGHTSSAWMSWVVTSTPSLFWYFRNSSRPFTSTRSPLLSDAATFSPYCPHTVTLKNWVGASTHSPFCW